MSARVFIDTNVLVYCMDANSAAKRAKALELIGRLGAANRLAFSTQVFQETYSALTRKLGVSGSAAERPLRALSGHPMVRTDLPLLWAAMQRHQKDGVSWYDALIVEAALAGKCAILASEDFQHHRQFGTLQVINPFTEDIV